MRTPLRALAALATLLVVAAWLSGPVGAYDTPSASDFDTFLSSKDRRVRFRAFEGYLVERGLDQVVPPWQLWRQGTDFRGLGEPAFAEPSEDQWEEIVPTLRLLRDEVIPLVGPLEVVSGFRTERYNARAGGSKGSRHKWFQAVDVVPDKSWERAPLHASLLRLWGSEGPGRAMGLGLYSGTRFHVDTYRYRRW